MKKNDVNHTKKIFGKNLKYYRFKKGLTQEQLAENINVDWTYISEMERGNKGARFDTLTKLSNALNTPISKFFDENIININIPNDIRNFKNQS